MQEWQEGDRVAVTKFNRQADDLGAVYLYKEGLFVRAYNEGAYAFISQVLVCKPVRRFIKYAGADRVVCGVPLAVATKLPGFAQASQVDKLTWRWPLTVPVERVLYDAWREDETCKVWIARKIALGVAKIALIFRCPEADGRHRQQCAALRQNT